MYIAKELSESTGHEERDYSKKWKLCGIISKFLNIKEAINFEQFLADIIISSYSHFSQTRGGERQ